MWPSFIPENNGVDFLFFTKIQSKYVLHEPAKLDYNVIGNGEMIIISALHYPFTYLVVWNIITSGFLEAFLGVHKLN